MTLSEPIRITQLITAVLEVQKLNLDRTYLERNAKQMQITALLKKAFNQAGIQEGSI